MASEGHMVSRLGGREHQTSSASRPLQVVEIAKTRLDHSTLVKQFVSVITKAKYRRLEGPLLLSTKSNNLLAKDDP